LSFQTVDHITQHQKEYAAQYPEQLDEPHEA